MTWLPSHSGLGAEEPLSSLTDGTSSPLSTGYSTRSGSEEIVTDSRDQASPHGSQELPANTRLRMRTASELLLDRCGAVGLGAEGQSQGAGLQPALPLQVPAHPRAGGG